MNALHVLALSLLSLAAQAKESPTFQVSGTIDEALDFYSNAPAHVIYEARNPKCVYVDKEDGEVPDTLLRSAEPWRQGQDYSVKFLLKPEGNCDWRFSSLSLTVRSRNFPEAGLGTFTLYKVNPGDAKKPAYPPLFEDGVKVHLVIRSLAGGMIAAQPSPQSASVELDAQTALPSALQINFLESDLSRPVALGY